MSEEVGKKLAQQFGSQLTPQQLRQVEDSKRAHLNDTIQKTLKSAFQSAVDAFNKQSSSPAKLTMIDGGNRSIFNYIGGLTVTVIFRNLSLDLEPRQASVNNVSQKVDILGETEPFEFRFRNNNPTVIRPVFDQEKLVEYVLRMALDQPLG